MKILTEPIAFCFHGILMEVSVDIRKFTQSNRKAWNEVQPYHTRGRTIDLAKEFEQPSYSTLDSLITARLKEIGLEGKRVIQLMCNNGREVLSMINMGATSGLGFDIADAFIEEARTYAIAAGANAEFVQSDAYDIDPNQWQPADMLYISIGALCWLPDMKRLFEIVSGLLKPGGKLIVYESHPIGCTLAFEDEPEYIPGHPMEPVRPYFHDGAWEYDTGIDYVGGVTYQSEKNFEFSHTLSTIINAIIRSGINILEFNEYPQDISDLMADRANNGILPMSYIIVGEKK